MEESLYSTHANFPYFLYCFPGNESSGLDIFTLFFVHNNIFHSLDGHFANPKNNH